MFLAKKLNNGAGTPAAPVDAQFNYVTMLLHGDGTNGAQNNTFLDSSTNNFTITRNGNTTQGSFSPYGSNWSNYFGTSDSFYFASNASYGIGTGNFTVEFWVSPSIFGSNQLRYFLLGQNGSTRIGIENDANGALNVYVGTNSASITYNWSPNINSWYHIAVVRSGTTVTLYINGTSVATATNSNSVVADTLFVGGLNWASGYGAQAYISNLRYTNTAVYTGSFTPSTAPLTAISGTLLLTCQSNRFLDNSSIGGTALNGNGTPSVQRFNPFGTSTAYSTSVIGGSGYFDGSGDYLVSPASSSYQFSGDFTIEYWANFSAIDGVMPIGQVYSGNNFQIYYIADGSIEFGGLNLGFVTTSAGVIVKNSWHHGALVRSGSTVTLYINGVSRGTITSSSTVGNNADIGIGARPNNAYNCTGYISNVRLVSSAVYTTTFTPPTTPFTAISGTVLLLSTTNGAIFDNAMMNDLETVGNAQISTSVKKYGTGSMYFDGSGDWLIAPDSPSLEFGSGNFTIECWINTTVSNSGYVSAVSKWGTSNFSWMIRAASTDIGTGWSFFYSTDGSNYYTVFGSSINDGNWHHLAVTRSGNVFRTFTDGTLNNSRTDAVTLFDGTASLFVGAQSAGGNPFTGYLDDIRITKGYARYTANFTAPTAAFSDTGPY